MRLPRLPSITLLLAAVLAACGDHGTSVPRFDFGTGTTRLTLEIDADDLVHFELSPTGAPSQMGERIQTTPMVARTDQPGPTRLTNDGHGGIATATLEIAIDPESLCMSFADKRAGRATPLTTVCPGGFAADEKSLTLSKESIRNLYGLGEHFLAPGQANGDLVKQSILPGSDVGNGLTTFAAGSTGRAQFPILYALGTGSDGYAVFLDQQQAQSWDFTGKPWRVSLRADSIRGYFLGGNGLRALHRTYMDLVGRPPVPPRRVFGLWVSEFSYDDWSELADKLRTLRANGFPVDGFLLDLQWFGGVFRVPSQIGALTFDEANFPDPAAEIARLRDQDGVGVMLIEEPYVDQSQPAYAELAGRGYLPLACADGCGPVDFQNWWGHGSMLDWTNDAAGDHWHDAKRKPLVDMGIVGHWTDLGEPEDYSPDALYAGFAAPGARSERDVHNLYDLAWAASIARGYLRNHTATRPFILSRSGTSGLQRFGGAMWSGDIASNMASLAAQQATQMHVALSGIDYFGSDVGGFQRAALEGDVNELYTQWFADSALTDVPLRPHTQNLCNCRETAPDRVGDRASNLENLRLRYRLIPYLYSLAYRAHRDGEPVVPPLVFYYPDEIDARTIADEKLLGRDLLVAMAGAYGQTARDVYLPAGTWIDFHTNQWLDSTGTWLRDVPTRRDGLLRLPLYARAGAILPEMTVDEQTMNSFGRRRDGTTRDELVVRVYADPQPTSFTLYEDDGESIAYLRGEQRTTTISQQRSGDRIDVTIDAAVGSYAGADDVRDNVVEIIARGEPGSDVTGVDINRAVLDRAATRAAFDGATSAVWYAAGDGMVLARSGPMPVDQRKEIRLRGGVTP